MPEIVLFEMERNQSRGEIADYLRQVADKLDSGEKITLQSGSESVTVDPPEQSEFEVKVEREGPEGGPYERSIELELEWDENQEGTGGTGGDLTIE
jgi:amphi-Trp domain-containing protein